MKILLVEANNRKKSIKIKTKQHELELPYSRLDTKPTAINKITKIFIDKQLASEVVTYQLQDGSEDSVPLDAFLDYNRDPEHIRVMTLHLMTAESLDLLKNNKVTKQELCRRLKTSMSQLNRLLDTTNHKKTIDSMIALLTALGAEVSWKISKAA